MDKPAAAAARPLNLSELSPIPSSTEGAATTSTRQPVPRAAASNGPSPPTSTASSVSGAASRIEAMRSSRLRSAPPSSTARFR